MERSNIQPRVIGSTPEIKVARLGDRLRAIARANLKEPSDFIRHRALFDAELAKRDLDEPLPLFLARAPDDVVEPPRAIQPRFRQNSRSARTKFMIALFAATMLVPFVLMRNSDAILADATASQFPENQNALMETKKPLFTPERASVETEAKINSSSPVPTRDDFVIAWKSAVPIPSEEPRPVMAAQQASRIMDKEELARLLKRGQYLLSVGNIASGRLFLERVAEANESGAALALAGTYDPAELGRSRVLGIVPDLAMARIWYIRALKMGSPEAQRRLNRLQN
jgi:hypothetical protein